MSISITRSDIKRKCMMSDADTTYDTKIDALITEMQPSIEYTISETYLNDTTNTRLQAVLKLGILEVLSGEFIQQLSREVGASEQLVVAGLTIGAGTDQGAKLIAQGTARLSSFVKTVSTTTNDDHISCTTDASDRIFTTDSMRVW